MDVIVELRKRKSPLVFKAQPVEREKIDVLVEAARWAPSCFNNQPWNYVFVHKSDPTREVLEGALSPGNGWAKSAPYLVAVGANPDEACKTNDLPYYAYDAGLSVMSLTVEAEHQGLRVHQMAGWSEQEVKAALGFPAEHRVIVVFALGYEGDAQRIWDTLEDRVKERLREPRERRPASHNFFFGTFKGSAQSPK